MNTALLILRWVAGLVLVYMISMLDMAFLPALGPFWIYANITITFALFLVIIFRFQLSALFFILAHLTQYLLGASLFFTPLVSGLVILFLLDLLLERVFTNRSYYVMVALCSIGWLGYNLLFSVFVFLIGLFSESSLPALSFHWAVNMIFHLIFVVILCSAGYVMTSFLSTRFKSYFITNMN